VGLTALIGIAEEIFGWDLHWEPLLFRGRTALPGLHPWLHTSGGTILCFYVLACSLILLSARRGYWTCQALTIVVIVIVLGTFVQRFYGIRPSPPHFEVGFVASLLLLILAAGILDSNGHRGLLAIVSSREEGGWMAQRLLPASIVIPVMLGWVRLWGENAGWFGPGAGLVLHVIFTITLLAAFV